jgi:hypothetical protein
MAFLYQRSSITERISARGVPAEAQLSDRIANHESL